MLRVESHQRLTPSLLDRLVTPVDPDNRALGYTFDIQQVIAAVQRDLEDLLNTRVPVGGVSAAFPETQTSVVNFGLPDLTSISAATDGEREEIGRIIESVIARFEPRLRQVQAHFVGMDKNRERTVRFLINARLAVDPAPEVAFETVLELMTGHTSVRSGGD
jgi:type VI secretion system protein ImpF